MNRNLTTASIASLFVSSVALAATPAKPVTPRATRTTTKAVEAPSQTPTNTTNLNVITPNSGTVIYSQGPSAAPSAAAEPMSAPMANPFAGRTFSLSATFPGGGSQPIGNALGARMKLDSDNWVGASLVLNNNTDNAEDKSIFGLSGKFQHFFGAEKRARPYAAGSMYIWKPGGDANDGADNTAFGLSGAIGAEVFFIPEFSAFVETGLFLDTSNVEDTETEFGTFASAIGVNFNFDM